MYKFVIGRNTRDEWYLKLVAANGQIIVWSEGYSSKQAVLNAIQLVKTHGPSAPITEV